MNRHFPYASAQCVLAFFLSLSAVPALGQETQSNFSAVDDSSTVLAMAEVGDVVRMTIGYSKLLRAEEPFGTIIIGDDTIANATVGSGNSIIVTGLSAGSTNLIVLGESQGMLMSSTIAVSPVAGPQRSAVIVMKGANMRERYECRGTACTLVDPQSPPTHMSVPLTPAREQVASGEDAAATE